MRSKFRKGILVLAMAVAAIASFLIGIAGALQSTQGENTYFCQNGGFGYLGAVKYDDVYTLAGGKIGSYGNTQDKYTPSGAFPCTSALSAGASSIYVEVELRSGGIGYTLCKVGSAYNLSGADIAQKSVSASTTNCALPCYYTYSQHSAYLYGDWRWNDYSSGAICLP